MIEIRGLSVSFGGRSALQGVDLECRRGELTMVVGRSGSGKTTLLRAVNRLTELFPACVTRGELRLRLDGEVIDVHDERLDVTYLRRRAGMVFQTPNVLPVSIERNFAVPLRHALGLKHAEIRERMERSLVEAELFDEVKDRLHDSARTLSGGQQQRLCLARALSLQPAILLLDEPTASLDFRATERIERLLAHLKSRYTILAVSHSLGQASRLADRCLVLRDGANAELLEREELREEHRLREVLEDLF